MGYPRDLDDFTEQEMLLELKLRRDRVAAGCCPYCCRPLAVHSCKYADAAHALQEYCNSIKVADGKVVVE